MIFDVSESHDIIEYNSLSVWELPTVWSLINRKFCLLDNKVAEHIALHISELFILLRLSKQWMSQTGYFPFEIF